MSRLRKSILTLRVKCFNLCQALGDNSGCHQRADRSFYCKGIKFPLCARCCGVLIGQISAIIIHIIGIPITNFQSLSLVSVMGIDWGLQETKLKESTNTRRLLSGICGGLGIYTLYINIIKRLFK